MLLRRVEAMIANSADLSRLLLRVFLCIVLFSDFVLAQEESPIIINYSAQEYHGHTQNWCVTQTSDGLIYVGNNNGIMEFDGLRWRTTQTPFIVRSLDVKENRTLYVGGQDDFGFLTADSVGKWAYVSLSKSMEDSLQGFGDVWQTFVMPDGIYFLSTDRLFRYRENQPIKTWSVPEKFHLALRLENRLFVKVRGGKLLELINENLVPIRTSTENQFDKTLIFTILPYSDQELLLGSYRDGLLLYHQETGESRPFKTEADEFLLKGGIYNGIIVPTTSEKDFYYALGTLNGGIALISKEGKVLQYISEKQGLQNPKIKNLFLDRNKALWVALNDGVSSINIQLPWRTMGKSHGLAGKVHYATVFKEKLIVCDALGVLEQQEGDFRRLENISGQTWFALPFKTDKDSVLLIGNQHGVFTYNKGVVDHIQVGLHVYRMIHHPYLRNVVYLLMEDGLRALIYKNGSWHMGGTIAEIDEVLRQCTLDANKNLWISSNYNGVYRLQFPQDTSVYQLTKNSYDSADHIYMNSVNYLHLFKDQKLRVGNTYGFFVYDEQQNTFIPDPLNSQALIREDGTYKGFNFAYEDGYGDIWGRVADIRNEYTQFARLISNTQGKVVLDSTMTRIFPEMEFIDMGNLSSNPSDMYVASSEGMLFYKRVWETLLSPTSTPYQALLRKVTIGQDSILFLGHSYDVDTKHVQLAYEHNDIKFQYAASYYLGTKEIEFSYWLEGYEKDWSPFTTDFSKEYTNLPPNETYVFHVRARNVFGEVSQQDSFVFGIETPFYRTYLAYFIYFILLIVVVLGIAKAYAIRLERKNMQLEAIVAERTKEVEKQKDEILLQNAELEQQKEEIEAQSENLREANLAILEKNHEIETQSEMLLKKNHAMVSSITYAKRIQTALLPQIEVINKFADTFLLFKPRDIVSGDFYFYAEHKSYVYYAVVDCTGHGVPGGFMSMIGYQLLNEIIHISQILEPAEILKELNIRVFQSLHQDESSSRDGMDISLVRISIEHATLTIASAHQGVYVYDKATEEMIVISGDRQGIGGKQSNEKDFTSHELRFESGVRIYLSTDGYQDQFGGIKEHKFTRKKFRETLTQVSSIPFNEQEEVLTKIFDDYKGDTVQTDDVLILGISFPKE